jgi:hypothetical protein
VHWGITLFTQQFFRALLQNAPHPFPVFRAQLQWGGLRHLLIVLPVILLRPASAPLLPIRDFLLQEEWTVFGQIHPQLHDKGLWL